MIARLHAMYQRSRKVLVYICIIFLAASIASGVMTVIFVMHVTVEELVLSGAYVCTIHYEGNALLLGSSRWILVIGWEVFMLCLALWIVVKHFRELRRLSAGGIIEDCFTVLIKSHVGYFASVFALSCFEIGYLSPALSANQYSLETQVYLGFSRVFLLAQMFLLGPRLILSVRKYNAKLVGDTDVGITMTSIAFQELVHVSTSSSV
ncbi:hypothetical protein EV702DRAFT_1148728 [Suillus placidus]|uniref:Uncharacterized protein n=1 Tax=Suillus placidus TaxID=48579 RepID=A0A9P6ZHS0_9AGAM|nr:hypothetical protein EV702DRAFT_1148728 [Suillus placidus]